MLEKAQVKQQSLKEYLKIEFNKEVYDFYHKSFKIKTGVNNIDIHKLLNSMYEITATFFNNCYELPYEANEFMIEQCNTNTLTHNRIIEKALLITFVQNLIFELGQEIIPKEKEGYRVIEIPYIVQNRELWTYWGYISKLTETANNKLKEKNINLDWDSDIVEVYYRDYCDRNKAYGGRVKEITDYFYSITKNNTLITQKKSKPILIDGVKPNISERYTIANEICNLYDTINKKNISATEKHKLLAHIMGCSQQVARELFNGTQVKRTPIRNEIIDNYLKGLN